MIRLVIVAVLLTALPACKRRAPGTCVDHIDCGARQDCVEGRCTKRAPVGGEPAAAPAPVPPAAPEAEPPPSAPAAPPPPQDDSTPSKPAPKAQPPAPLPASPPPAEREPLWKQRRKNA